MTFQTSGSSRSASLGTLDKGGDYLVSDTDPGKTREGLFKREAVLFGVMAGASVFDKHEAKAETSALARSGLDACVGRDTGENNGIDSTGLELVFQVGASKGTPMTLGEGDVARPETGGSSNLRRNRRRRGVAQIVRLVDGELQEVVEVDADIDDRSAVGAERFGESLGIFDDLRGSVGFGMHGDNGVLQVNEDKCGLLRVELKFCHGLL